MLTTGASSPTFTPYNTTFICLARHLLLAAPHQLSSALLLKRAFQTPLLFQLLWLYCPNHN
ncbi:hypothetical protein DSO57_1030086 [Entomophthora muscae]|uniref:Uncharacterized protein n=1 Tax=Entomophthora muscae TaxID=34485 RepID=A0ACC2TMS0_9FUNG|nr:hypothetical protein DSO57_1030086 [Entomophthora muscae]